MPPWTRPVRSRPSEGRPQGVLRVAPGPRALEPAEESASPKSASRSSRPGTVTRCEADVISDCIIRGRQREACQRCLTKPFQPASLQRIRAIEWASAASGSSPSVSDRYETQRPAANPRGPSAPGPGALGGHASWLLGPRSRSDACGFELAPGGVRDGNYAHFPAPARELSPAPGPRRLSRSKVASWGCEVLTCPGPG